MIAPARLAASFLTNPQSNQLHSLVSLTPTHFPPGVKSFSSSYGTSVTVAEFSDGNPIPQDAYKVAKRAALDAIELDKSSDDRRILFCCDYGQSRSVTMVIASIYFGLTNLIDNSPEQIPDWTGLKPHERLISVAAHVCAARIGGFPSHDVWNDLLKCINSDPSISDTHKLDLQSLKLLDGKNAQAVNFIFIRSRVAAHRLHNAICDGSAELASSIGQLPAAREKGLSA